MSSASSPAVEKIQRCHLSQWRICDINPRIGANTEVVVKKSIEASMTRQHLRGTVRLNDPREKRTKPDIYIEACGRHLSFDVRHWTSTQARAGRVYKSREFYEYARGESSLTTFLKDTKRFLYIVFELAVIDSSGNRERRLFCVPGLWLQDQFDHSIGVKIDYVAEAWPSYGKNQSLLYDIDLWKLIEIADNYQGARRS
jgi:hypothetical protein